MPGFFSRDFWRRPVSPKHGDYALLACSFVTGLLDCATFNNWSVFVGMQTGIIIAYDPGIPHIS